MHDFKKAKRIKAFNGQSEIFVIEKVLRTL